MLWAVLSVIGIVVVLSFDMMPERLAEEADAVDNAYNLLMVLAVPVLAGLLGDEKMAHYARYGLEPIPDASVDAALAEFAS